MSKVSLLLAVVVPLSFLGSCGSRESSTGADGGDDGSSDRSNACLAAGGVCGGGPTYWECGAGRHNGGDALKAACPQSDGAPYVLCCLPGDVDAGPVCTANSPPGQCGGMVCAATCSCILNQAGQSQCVCASGVAPCSDFNCGTIACDPPCTCIDATRGICDCTPGAPDAGGE
jgi:hypothetical protein